MSEFDDDFKPEENTGGGGDYSSGGGGSYSGNSGGYGGGDKGGYRKGGYEKKEYPPLVLPLSVTFYSNKELPGKAFDQMVIMAKEFNHLGYQIRVPLVWDHAKRFIDAVGFKVLKYGPWKKEFNEINPDTWANAGTIELIKKIHTNLDSLKDSVKAMVACPPATLLGNFSSSPSQYLVVFTRDGALNKASCSKDTGYSSLIIKMADIMKTEVLNLGNDTFRDTYDKVRSSIINPDNY